MIRVFSYYVSKGMLLLLALEIVVLLLAIPLAVHIRFPDLALAPPPALIWDNTRLFALGGLAFMAAFGLYRWDSVEGLTSMVFRVGASFLLLLLGMAALFYLVPELFLGRGVLLIASALALVGVVLLRTTFFRWVDLDILKHRVLVLGTGTRAAKVMALMREGDGHRRMKLVGFLPLQGTHHFVDHSLILPDRAPLTEIVDRYQIDEIVIAVRERRGGGLPVQELLECRLKGIQVVELATFFERERGQMQLESLNASWMVLSEGFRQGVLRDSVKRAFDLTVSLAMLAATLPIMLVTAVVILLESGRPILYRQERVGQGGRIFSILKFRSMVQNAEQDGRPRWAQAGDARITPFGRFIRKTRIDELPQLVNVLRGDMSFVGPRPERPYFVDQLIEQIPYYAARHSVKPGITGWAQVRYPYGASLEDAIEKLQYDLYYVKNHTFFLDLLILFQTAQVVLFGKGAR